MSNFICHFQITTNKYIVYLTNYIYQMKQLRQMMLKVIRKTKCFFMATQKERLCVEKLVKSKYVYDYREL